MPRWITAISRNICAAISASSMGTGRTGKVHIRPADRRKGSKGPRSGIPRGARRLALSSCCSLRSGSIGPIGRKPSAGCRRRSRIGARSGRAGPCRRPCRPAIPVRIAGCARVQPSVRGCPSWTRSSSAPSWTGEAARLRSMSAGWPGSSAGRLPMAMPHRAGSWT